jgi:hypothetical protein
MKITKAQVMAKEWPRIKLVAQFLTTKTSNIIAFK